LPYNPYFTMKRLLFFGILLAICSCKKQTQESTNEQIKKQENIVEAPALPINRHDSIPFDSELVKKLSTKEVRSIFTRRRENQLGISNNVYQGYSYKDTSGEYFLLLTDRRSEITKEKDTLYNNIYAVNVRKTGNQFKKRSSITDEIDDDWETSIGFWNQYSEIADFDKDGEVDFIVVYGTTGQNGYEDGKVRIKVFYKKNRVSIKHQNSEIASGRFTKISSKFYNLPIELQKATIEKMKLMRKNRHAIFVDGWEDKIAKKEVRLEPK